jgi:hypothetical protein
MQISIGVTAIIKGLTITGGYRLDVGQNYGSGIYSNQANLTLEDVHVVGNFAADVGGGIYSNAGNLTLINSVVKDNISQNRGGGIHASGTANQVQIIGSKITHNTAGLDGGGLSSSSTSLSILNSDISNNSGNRGGGVRLTADSADAVSITGSTFSNNSSTAGSGGGLLIERDGSTNPTITITNSTLSTNISAIDGGGLFVNSNAAVNIYNTTFTLNQASDDGGGLNVEASSSVTLHNSIVAQNTSGTNSADWRGTINAASSHNLVGVTSGIGSGLSNGINGNKVGTAASPINPLLAPLGDYGGPTKTHALLPGSPAIDRGSNTYGATTDQRGFARNVDDTVTTNNPGETVDIGAFELPSLKANGDLDGDHRADEIRHDPITGSLQVTTLSSGQPKVAIWGQLDEVANFISPQTGDFNGDGRDDLLIQRFLGTWTIAISDGSQFVIRDTGILGSWSPLFVGDFDGDGSHRNCSAN